MTSPRLRRLHSDEESIDEAFSKDPHVDVSPLGDARPPEKYEVRYRVKGLRRVGDHPEYVDEHKVEIRLPIAYPSEQPYCVPTTPVFHPNVQEYFCIADHWAAATSLVDVIVKIGEMIQWREFNIDSPLDADAAQWARDHQSAEFLPVGDVDLRRAQSQAGSSGSTQDERPRITINPDAPAKDPDAGSEKDADAPAPDAPKSEVDSKSDDEVVVVIRPQ